MPDSTADPTTTPTEQHYRCPGCKVPRFLAASSRGLRGVLRRKCPKCRTEVVFDLASGARLQTQPLRSRERELRCGGCRRFLVGVVVTAGRGHVRLTCSHRTRDGQPCKSHNHFKVSAETVDAVDLPVG